MLGELTSLSRDLLIRQTAPAAGLTLMAGGYDEATLNTLAKNMPPERLIAMLELLEQATEDCKRSGSSRTVAEICLIRLCDPSLDGSNAGLAARIAKLEAAVAQGIPVRASAPAATGCSDGAGAAPSGGSPPLGRHHAPTPGRQRRAPDGRCAGHSGSGGVRSQAGVQKRPGQHR